MPCCEIFSPHLYWTYKLIICDLVCQRPHTWSVESKYSLWWTRLKSILLLQWQFLGFLLGRQGNEHISSGNTTELIHKVWLKCLIFGRLLVWFRFILLEEYQICIKFLWVWLTSHHWLVVCWTNDGCVSLKKLRENWGHYTTDGDWRWAFSFNLLSPGVPFRFLLAWNNFNPSMDKQFHAL